MRAGAPVTVTVPLLCAVLAAGACDRTEVFYLNIEVPPGTVALDVFAVVNDDRMTVRTNFRALSDGGSLPTRLGVELKRPIDKLLVWLTAHDRRDCTKTSEEETVVMGGAWQNVTLSFPDTDWICPDAGVDVHPDTGVDRAADLGGDQVTDVGADRSADMAVDQGADTGGTDVADAGTIDRAGETPDGDASRPDEAGRCPSGGVAAAAPPSSSPQCSQYCASFVSTCDQNHRFFADESDCLFKCARIDWTTSPEPASNDNFACRLGRLSSCTGAAPNGMGRCGSVCENYCNLLEKACGVARGDCSCSEGDPALGCAIEAAVKATVSSEWCALARQPSTCRACIPD